LDAPFFTLETVMFEIILRATWSLERAGHGFGFSQEDAKTATQHEKTAHNFLDWLKTFINDRSIIINVKSLPLSMGCRC